jgi:hypothetical protein
VCVELFEIFWWANETSGSKAKESCPIDKLCAGLKAGIEGGIHAIQHL